MNFFADAEHYSGDDFELFGEAHLMAVTLIVLAEVLLLNRARTAGEATKRRIRVGLATGLVAQELSYHAWRKATGTWTPTELLPLHLCSVAVWFGAIMLFTTDRRIYEHLYFLAPVGATVALLTPDIGRFGFPHYRFFQFFLSHGLILLAPAWMTFVEGRRPGRGSAARAFAGTLTHAAGAYLVNRRLGSNYMFVNRKPGTASALDKLPAWPGYLPYMAGAVAAAYGLLYLPWAIRDARA